ncbi:MAG TPA: DUF2442 domain-containing protein [Bryobacteraceae bacterium]|nr:DUF2442 domain-containing protein [Bryobacteraceae bacterium]
MIARVVTVREEALIVDLADSRTITVPLAWFPRLRMGVRRSGFNGILLAAAWVSTGRTLMKIFSAASMALSIS